MHNARIQAGSIFALFINLVTSSNDAGIRMDRKGNRRNVNIAGVTLIFHERGRSMESVPSEMPIPWEHVSGFFFTPLRDMPVIYFSLYINDFIRY